MILLDELKTLFPDKKTSQDISNQDRLEEYLKISNRIFTEKNGDIYIGGEKISIQIRELLRDQSKNFQTTQLWEILYASILNEAYNLALAQSQNFDHVQFAKALAHWNKFVKEVLVKLAK